MSLKRKASFSNIALPSSPIAGPKSTMMDISPRHLHSRTRKRYRNDRPDVKIVYENTLRWLFTAQQKCNQQGPTVTMSDEENGMDSEPLPTPETLDPRQQTLHKFFQPSQSSTPRARANPTVMKSTTQSTVSFSQPPTLDIRPTMATMGSDTTVSSSPAPYTDMDVDMDVEMDSGSDQSVQAPQRWPGELGWM